MPKDAPDAPLIDLRLLATSDLHVHLLPYDYYADAEAPGQGLGQLASVIRAARAEAQNALLFDNGDLIQGTPMGDFAHEAALTGTAHPMIAAMNALGYDAATLGNHEFNYGLNYLRGVMAGAAHPVVLANVATRLGPSPAEDAHLFAPYALLERDVTDRAGGTHRLRVGVIGVVPPQIMAWDRRHLEGRAQARDMVEAAQALIPQLRAKGADMVVALVHSGIGPELAQPGMENAAIPLAALPGIDAMILGHTHRRFPGPDHGQSGMVNPAKGRLHGVPAVMPGYAGSHLGVIDLVLEAGPTGVSCLDASCHLRALEGAPIDPAVQRSAQAPHAGTLNYMRKPVGVGQVPLHSFFSLLTEDAAQQLVHEAQLSYARRLLGGSPLAALPLLSAAAPFRAGGVHAPDSYTNVPAGPLAMKHVADLYKYPNALQVVKVTGAMVRAWLERSASLFCQVPEGAQGAPLAHPDYPSYNFDTIHGLRYQIDLSAPQGFGPDGAVLDPAPRRIQDLMLAGAPLSPLTDVLVVTNSYRAAGGDGFPFLDGSQVVLEAPDNNQQALAQHIASGTILQNNPTPAWRFKPQPGSSVIHVTSAAARPFLDDARNRAGLKIEDIGDTPDGLAQLRIWL